MKKMKVSVVVGSVSVLPPVPHVVDYEKGVVTFLEVPRVEVVNLCAAMEPMKKNRKTGKRRVRDWWVR